MEETRIARYRKYRSSLLKNKNESLSTQNQAHKTTKNNCGNNEFDIEIKTTNSIPYDTIIEGVNSLKEEKSLVWCFKKKKIFKAVLLIFVSILLLTGLVFLGLGVFIWWK